MKILIIGGVAGGATTAARIRRMDENAEIMLIEKGEHISYANCGLPYYIGEVIQEREKLFVQTPEKFSIQFGVDVRTESEVIAIHRNVKSVTIRRKDGTTYSETYDKLLLSPGASPVVPSLPGIDLEGIFTLRNVPDTDRIKQFVDERCPHRAIVIGGGFIGLEMAENLHARGMEVHIVEMGNQVMAPIDFSMASLLHQHLIEKGVHLHLEKKVQAFEKNEEGLQVNLENGEKITTDVVILSIGVRPENRLAQEAGLAIGKTGGISVNAHLQTSDENIYAIGDAIEYPHPITGQPWLNYLAGPANRQGRIVADNLLGAQKTYEGSIGTAIAKVFDMTIASTGLAAKRLQQMGRGYRSVTIHPSSHAGYYPNALPMSIKLLFAPNDGKIYGAQAVGYEGVDKRIDQIALAIKQKGDVNMLTSIEHAYAPPFSSAKDPVALLGYVASNLLAGKMQPKYWREVRDIIQRGSNNSEILFVDVRSQDEFQTGSLAGAINIPLENLRQRCGELPKDKDIILLCSVGLRGYLAHRILTQKGFTRTYNLIGGLKTYRTATASITAPRNKCLPLITPSLADKIPSSKEISLHVDACGLQCPGPILKMKRAIESMKEGDCLQITSTDAGFPRDAEAWCRSTGHRLISSENAVGRYTVVIEKVPPAIHHTHTTERGEGKTFILFSDNLDKALATFVLANGAAATGKKTTIFFTFWGLNAIKKVKKPPVQKDFFGKMFGWMLPAHSGQLKLSKLSMGGLGGWMMRFLMKQKGIDSLESLRQQALENGVEFIACQMSMDVMGVTREELMDEVTIGGVATYMNRADEANVNLFI